MASIVKTSGVDRRDGRQRCSIKRLVQELRRAWRFIIASIATYIPPDEPQPSPPLAKAAVLREGALLSEHVDAQSKSAA
jgi:hypothetical protein